MPYYDYKCDACHREFEVFQNMGAPPIDLCDVCGEDGKVKKMIVDINVVHRDSDEQRARKNIDDFITSTREDIEGHKKDVRENREDY